MEEQSGFPFTRTPETPEYQVDVSGVFPNGTTFFVTATAETLPRIVSGLDGQAVSGLWGSEAGFEVTRDLNKVALAFNQKPAGVRGGAIFERDRTPAHVACEATTSGSFYFDSVARAPLSPSQHLLYDETGWAIAMRRANASVSVDIGGTWFNLTGRGYHDHNWAPESLDTYIYTWLFGAGSCGPFDLGYVEVQPLNSTRKDDVVQGTLAYEGQILQTECNLYGTRSSSIVTVELVGKALDPITGQTVPTGVNLEYILGNGTHYQFNLTNTVTNPDQVPYKRWRYGGSGGQLDGPQYECSVIADWLNPGLAEYTPGENIFAKGNVGV
ncbi:hypothetical protein Asppvi_009955 [Aspergillus pseudoviridinutans]|uniref:Uncharacterized protein n=1 Tax=Aspergillus pseudoviridinutans TaxID=1517512 RepID=A0A9P3BKH6_9EURO|nr:uncharacterized protein Asppvi_009955 [Aspergillus pseudoviridinutans]GIJ90990.1 hypothetical protein Asppvi_009955 [Aspergillus pseudoviridinutans]